MNSNNLNKREYNDFKKEKTESILDTHHLLSAEFEKLRQIILTDDLLFKNEQYVVSPTVFCKKVQLSSLEGVSPRLIILENLLRIVCQAYYKSEYSIGNLIQELEKKGSNSYNIFQFINTKPYFIGCSDINLKLQKEETQLQVVKSTAKSPKEEGEKR
jgi:hypothetical protein